MSKTKRKEKMTDAAIEKLHKWQEIIAADEIAYEAELSAMDKREALYRGSHELTKIVSTDDKTQTPHVRNICAELIEAQITSNIPQPKVSALRKKNEALAQLIEDLIRNKLNVLPMESINDQMERTVPIQGGAFEYLQWDSKRRSRTTNGDSVVSYRHPKQVIPQEGITSDIEDMDHITLRIPQTAKSILREYGVNLERQSEEKPEIRSADGSVSSVPDMLTQYIVYSKNENGGVDKYSWVCDVVLEDIEDYQARHARVCDRCGAHEPMFEIDEIPPTLDGTYPLPEDEENSPLVKKYLPNSSDKCPHCGGKLKDTTDDYQITDVDITLLDERVIPAGTKIPYFKPDIFPVFLQRNVSSFGKLLGESDIDKIADQQNSINRLWAKMIDQVLTGGSYLLLPQDASIKVGTGEFKEIRYKNIADVTGIKAIDVTLDISSAQALIEQAYKEAQQIIGVTDSFLGRKDSTATSGKAKEFSAAQAAGRMDSKRVMKNEAAARLHEAIFKFQLAYADEPRPIIGIDERGNHRDEEWDKWAFLEIDDAGEAYWNTDFLFETDSSAPLAQNREAMWQETRSHFESGAFGDKAALETQIMYWDEMNLLHYPGAVRIRNILREKKKKQDELQLEQANAQKEALNQAKADVAAAGAGGIIQQMSDNAAQPQEAATQMNTGGEM